MAKSVRCELPRSAIGLLAGASVLALATAVSAHADDSQGESAEGRDRDVIIVTATKREEDLQDVPLTVVAIPGRQIDDYRTQSVIELATLVGGLSLTMTSPSEESLSLRGIKMPSAGGAGGTTNTVESYLNEVPISSLDLFTTTLDIGQVEVLKGPQGTLRGRPSPSGAMTLATRRPTFDDYEGYVDASLSDHEGRNLQVAYGGPISDTLAFRLAGVYDYNGGTEVKNINNGESNYSENYVVRGSLTFVPNNRFNADLMTQYTDEEGDFYRQITGTAPCAGDPVPGGGVFPVDSVACGQTFTLFDKIALTTGPNPNSYEGWLTTVNASYQLRDNLELIYVGGYNDTSQVFTLDFDFAGVGYAANFLESLTPQTDIERTTNELRLQSIGNEFYNFTFGIFAQTEKNHSVVDFPPLFAGVMNEAETDDFGLFTNQRFELSENDSLQLGVRYSHVEVKDVDAGTERTYQAITGNASYQHYFTDDIMAYVSYGLGFRPGSAGANGSPRAGVVPVEFGNFEDEHSQSLEYGLKTLLFDDRVTANLAIFDQEYDGYITSQFNIACTGNPSGPGEGVQNATDDGTLASANCFGTMFDNGDAVSQGVEFEFNAYLTDNWTVGGVYTYTDAHFDNALLPCNDYNGDGVLDTDGPPMVQEGRFVSLCPMSGPLGALPTTSWSANTNYDFSLGQFGAYIRANAIVRDEYFFPQTGRNFESDERVNVYFGLRSPDDLWEISLWAKNVFDNVVEDTDGGDWTIGGNIPSGLRIGTVTNDREIGASVRRTF